MLQNDVKCRDIISAQDFQLDLSCSLCAGATHISTADFPMPNRHSMSEPAYFDEVDPEMNRRIS